LKFVSKTITFTIIILSGITFNDAYAYVDPGTGGAIIQAAIGALVAVGIGIKIYWQRIRMKFSSLKNR